MPMDDDADAATADDADDNSAPDDHHGELKRCTNCFSIFATYLHRYICGDICHTAELDVYPYVLVKRSQTYMYTSNKNPSCKNIFD